VVGPVLGTSCKISSVPVGFDGVIAVARKASTLVTAADVIIAASPITVPVRKDEISLQ
jgi:hypothetical protein